MKYSSLLRSRVFLVRRLEVVCYFCQEAVFRLFRLTESSGGKTMYFFFGHHGEPPTYRHPPVFPKTLQGLDL
jgi:hypothetical protein